MPHQPDDGALPACFTCGMNDDAAVCGALGDLYTSAGGAGWYNSSGWASAASGTPTEYCTFYGVSCDGDDVLYQLCVCAHSVPAQQRAALRRLACARSEFYDNQLAGSIPSSLGSLSGLQNLCVRRIACHRAPSRTLRRRARVLAATFPTTSSAGAFPAASEA